MTPSLVKLYTGESAFNLVGENQFIKQWLNLFEHCEYATVFQHPSFVRTWYKTYYQQWKPVIIQSANNNGVINGLWFLACNIATRELEHAGACQAEYRVWLASKNEEIPFLTQAFNLLKSNFRFRELHFKYLPNSGLCNILMSISSAKNCTVWKNYQRPLLLIEDGEANKHSKKTRKRFNHLKKLGNLEFRRIKTIEEFDSVIDDFVHLNNYRMGAIKGVLPFRKDKLKREFHRNLFLADPESFLVTVTYFNGQPFAGEFAGFSKGTIYLYLGMLNPFLHLYSPGIIHFINLTEYAANEKISRIDLTPGGDSWKERLSTTYETVAYAIVYQSRLAKLRHELKDTVWEWGKKILAKIGVNSNRVKNEMNQGLISIQTTASIIKAGKWNHFKQKLLLFECIKNHLSRVEPGKEWEVKQNSIPDLLDFIPDWRMTKSKFLSGTYKSIEMGAVSYSVSTNNCLLANVWVMKNQTSFRICPNKAPVNLPAEGTVLFNFYLNHHKLNEADASAITGQILKSIFSEQEAKTTYAFIESKHHLDKHVLKSLNFQRIEY